MGGGDNRKAPGDVRVPGGEAKGERFLAKEIFQGNKDIAHVHNKIDPEDDRETINVELIFADLSTVEKRLTKVIKEAKSGDKEAIKLQTLLEKIKEILESGKAARDLELEAEDKKLVKGLNLLTTKPIIYVLNQEEKDVEKNEWDGEVLALNIKQEEEIASLDEAEQKEYIKELGLEQSGLDKLIKTSYKLLGLLTFFTTGEDETRAWTVEKNSKAPQAAGVMKHMADGDFVHKFGHLG